MGIFFAIGGAPLSCVQIDVIDVVRPNGGFAVVLLQVLKKLAINVFHHRLDGDGKTIAAGIGIVNDCIIVAFGNFQCLEMGVIHFNIGFSVTILDDVNHEIVHDFTIHTADSTADECIFVHHIHPHGILPIFAQVGNNVADAHYICFQGGGNQLVYIALFHIGLLQHVVQLCKALQRNGDIFSQLHLAVVAGDTVQGLQTHIQCENAVQHSHRVDAVVKMPTGVLVIKLVQITLTGMGKGRVPQIMT